MNTAVRFPEDFGRRALAVLLAIMLVTLLTIMVIILPGKELGEPQEMVVRKLDFQLPAPPEPPPPVEPKTNTNVDMAAAMNVAGFDSSVSLSYDDKPKLKITKINSVAAPEFDLDSLNLSKTLSVQFPIVGVQNLDSMPKIVSSKLVSIPRSLRQQGIFRVETKVQIIITETGRAYIKKIIDPVYPDMVEPIRDYIKHIKFTPPTKSGRPVQAEYLFELNFSYRVFG